MLVRYGEGDLDAEHLRRMTDLVDSGDMDQADVQRVLGMLGTKGTSPFLDSDLTASDLLTSAGKKSQLDETRVVARDHLGRVRWLETGNSNTGWQHILDRHEGQFYDPNGIESGGDIRKHIYIYMKQ